MNCNPFTLGHYHLIKIASQIVDYLYIFVVQEDKSDFPYKDRFRLVKTGVSEFKNVRVFPSGRYIISNITFPEYFDKENNQETIIDSSTDLRIFSKYIAPALDVTVRFVGEEPSDKITRQYNEHMRSLLPMYGIKYIELPRVKTGAQIISASTVRKCLVDGTFDDLKMLVPATTYEYLKERILPEE